MTGVASLPSASELTALASLLSPGFVILWVRGRFRNTLQPKLADQTISFALVSVAYQAAVYPLFHAESGVQLPNWIWQFLLSMGVPLVIAVMIVFLDRSELFYKLTDRVGLRLSHHEPTAWDYAFRNRHPSYILVHLNDGSTVAGTWAEGAFASSIGGDRDLLIASVWKVGEGKEWEQVLPSRSMLICGGSIRLVEFIDGGRE